MKSLIVREVFDATNATHVTACVEFFKTGRWTKHFELEEPAFTQLPYQVLLQYFLTHASR